MAASGRPVRSLDPRTGGMSRPREDSRRGCQGSEKGTWDEECVGLTKAGVRVEVRMGLVEVSRLCARRIFSHAPSLTPTPN